MLNGTFHFMSHYSHEHITTLVIHYYVIHISIIVIHYYFLPYHLGGVLSNFNAFQRTRQTAVIFPRKTLKP